MLAFFPRLVTDRAVAVMTFIQPVIVKQITAGN
jgi:hypothetical protein